MRRDGHDWKGMSAAQRSYWADGFICGAMNAAVGRKNYPAPPFLNNDNNNALGSLLSSWLPPMDDRGSTTLSKEDTSRYLMT